MNDQIACAAVLCTAASAFRSEQRLVVAIELYIRACVAYSHCGAAMVSNIGLINIEISDCLSELGEAELSDLYFLKAINIMRQKAPLMILTNGVECSS